MTAAAEHGKRIRQAQKGKDMNTREQLNEQTAKLEQVMRELGKLNPDDEEAVNWIDRARNNIYEALGKLDNALASLPPWEA